MTPNAERESPPVWPESATLEEVREFALDVLSKGIAVFTDGARCRDWNEMENGVRIIRNVSTRLDQFRRMKHKQWAELAPRGAANSKGEI